MTPRSVVLKRRPGHPGLAFGAVVDSDNNQVVTMQFIEMTGKTLALIIDEHELHMPSLTEAGISDDSIVRVNQQGDIEVRRPDRWDVVGGLLGNYVERIRRRTGFDWA